MIDYINVHPKADE